MTKVLLVEDDNNLREIYEARLAAEGYDIVTAKDGEEALEVAKQHRPELIISDVMMPRISGFEMLDILRTTNGLKDAKVIMLTALGQAEDRSRADHLGADRYLVKSQVTLEDIVNAASELINGEATDTIPAETPPASFSEEPAAPAAPATPAIQHTVTDPGAMTPQPTAFAAQQAPVEPVQQQVTAPDPGVPAPDPVPTPAPEPVMPQQPTAPAAQPVVVVPPPAPAPEPVMPQQPITEQPMVAPVPAVDNPLPMPAITSQPTPTAPAPTPDPVVTPGTELSMPTPVVEPNQAAVPADPVPPVEPVSNPETTNENNDIPVIELPDLGVQQEGVNQEGPNDSAKVQMPANPDAEVVNGAQTSTDEEAAIEQQIEQFIHTDSVMPQGTNPEPAPEIEPADTSPAEESANASIINSAVEQLVNDPTADAAQAPAATEPQVTTSSENGSQISGKKVISPMPAPENKADLATLVAQEEMTANAEKGITGDPVVADASVPAEPKTPPLAISTDAPAAGGVFSPNTEGSAQSNAL